MPELEKQGHYVITPELRFDDVAATTESLVADISAVITRPSDTVLVSHSTSGLVGAVVAERMPLRELVLLSSMLPAVGLSFREQQTAMPGALPPEFAAARASQPLTPQGGTVWEANQAYRFFYQDCDRQDAAEAIRRLRPCNASAPLQERTPLTGRPNVPTRFVVCTLDRTLAADWVKRMAVRRFGASIVEFESSHVPFWSRPADLATLLTQGHRSGAVPSGSQV